MLRRGAASPADDSSVPLTPPEKTKETRRQRWCTRCLEAHAWLVQPVHASTLGMFRLLFGVVMVMQAGHFADMYEEFVQAKLLLPYPGLYWLPPIGPAAGEAMLKLNMVSAYLVSLGVCTRASTVVLCATFCYLFLQCESNHNNHYILICHATFFGSLSDWGRWASVDQLVSNWRRRRRPSSRAAVDEPATLPYWHLLGFQILFSIPYSYGAVAKVHEPGCSILTLCTQRPRILAPHPRGRASGCAQIAFPRPHGVPSSCHETRAPHDTASSLSQVNEDWLLRAQPLKASLRRADPDPDPDPDPNPNRSRRGSARGRCTRATSPSGLATHGGGRGSSRGEASPLTPASCRSSSLATCARSPSRRRSPSTA